MLVLTDARSGFETARRHILKIYNYAIRHQDTKTTNYVRTYRNGVLSFVYTLRKHVYAVYSDFKMFDIFLIFDQNIDRGYTF